MENATLWNSFCCQQRIACDTRQISCVCVHIELSLLVSKTTFNKSKLTSDIYLHLSAADSHHQISYGFFDPRTRHQE